MKHEKSILTKHHNELWNSAEELKHAASNHARSDDLQPQIGAVGDVLPTDRQQDIVDDDHKQQPPTVGGAGQNTVHRLARHHGRRQRPVKKRAAAAGLRRRTAVRNRDPVICYRTAVS